MVRVLHVLNNLGSGGAESFVMNVYRNIDRSKVQFDFLIRSDKNNSLLAEIENMGGRVYQTPAFPRRIFSNYKALNCFMKKHCKDYKVVHVHANALVYVKPLQLAYKYGIPCRILHSHSTDSKLKAIHKFNQRRVVKWATHRFACSNLAGKWMFRDNGSCFIPNGIDLKRFAFNEAEREEMRLKLKLTSKFVVGNVGRFSYAKNHPFIIQVFEQLHKVRPESVLLLVGGGDGQQNIKELVNAKGLTEAVVFIGEVNDVQKYMSAMDCFLFPSHYEGLGIVLVEAQTNGIPCVASDVIPQEAILGNVVSLSLNDPVQDWVKAVLKSKRTKISEKSRIREFDIKTVAKRLEDFYLR